MKCKARTRQLQSQAATQGIDLKSTLAADSAKKLLAQVRAKRAAEKSS